MWGRARQRAGVALSDNIEVFRRLGFRDGERLSLLEAVLEPGEEGRRLRLRMAQQGRMFGGAYALEIETAEPVLPATKGLAGRARGVVRQSSVVFHPRGTDPEGRRLAEGLSADGSLSEALGRVHFERVRVDPRGRPVIRHMGGALVWVLFPPLIRAVPLVPEQATATLAALEAFAAAGESAQLGP